MKKEAADKGLPPIFIHSSWRSSSTYVYSLFRKRTELYYAFQESLNEVALLGQRDPRILLQSNQVLALQLRHPDLGKPYFQELHDTYAAWANVLQKPMLYDDFFGTADGVDTAAFFDALIGASPRRPVFQECRTGMRIAKLRERLGGVHLVLIRNPRDTWWSYKVNEFFERARALCVNAANPPASILALREAIGFVPFSASDIMAEFGHFSRVHRSPANSYLEHCVLWGLALRHALDHADLVLDIDRMTKNAELRQNAGNRLEALGVPGIDLEGVHAPQRWYQPTELDFYRTQEARAIELLEQSGVSTEALLAFCGNDYWSAEPHADVSAAAEYRGIVRRLEEQAHEYDRAAEIEKTELLNTVQALSAEKAELLDSLKEASGHYANLDRAFTAGKDEVQSLREQLAAAPGEASDLHTKIHALDAEKAELIESLKERSGQYAKLDLAFAAGKDEIQSLKEQLAVAQGKANDLYTKIQALDVEKAELLDSLNEVYGKHTKLDLAFAASKDEIQSLREQLAASQNEASNLHTKIHALGTVNEALRAEVEDWRDKHARARQRSTDLQSELATAEAALAVARQRILAIESSRTWRWTRSLRRDGT
ncbi:MULTISPECIES: hypothetical protein [unclassified Mesorhizobium]|uniref:hypothetical protein n=1 Tax=unclassified Mesorhizobium TaxID=325217 RepID=UPI00112E7409|nr:MULTISPECIES: hypothetical protein [unclassified Mesorhizobium]MBZ9702490.1 hypothetical protein [Mesorhizobium sp. CO1-1-3]MBZ9948794.1 hypothetical protein [Mesorhizobium sp. BR1-1-11]TPJ09588.1 hypothetical protein FJ428_02865 [Mesorhizobium sp. B2-8-1]